MLVNQWANAAQGGLRAINHKLMTTKNGQSMTKIVQSWIWVEKDEEVLVSINLSHSFKVKTGCSKLYNRCR